MKNRGNCDARHLTRLPPGVYWGPPRAAGRPGREHAVRFRRFFPLAMAALAAFLLAGSDVTVDGVTTSFSCLLVSGEAADNNMIKGLEVKRCIDGISIYAGADGNTVGGSAPTDRNLIHSNGSHGVLIAGSASTSNIVAGNYIGTNAAGSAAMPHAIGVP